MKMKCEEIGDPQGGRNRIRKGDTVKVKIPGKTSFKATFHGATVIDGTVVDVEVYGGPHGIAGWRVLRPSTIHRVAQTKGGVRKAVAR